MGSGKLCSRTHSRLIRHWCEGFPSWFYPTKNTENVPTSNRSYTTLVCSCFKKRKGKDCVGVRHRLLFVLNLNTFSLSFSLSLSLSLSLLSLLFVQKEEKARKLPKVRGRWRRARQLQPVSLSSQHATVATHKCSQWNLHFLYLFFRGGGGWNSQRCVRGCVLVTLYHFSTIDGHGKVLT